MATENEKPSISVPTIHRNGTSYRELFDGVVDALEAGRVFREKLEAIAPNDRDYYPQRYDAGIRAREEHSSRIRKVDEIYAELFAILDGIIDQRGN